MTFIETEKWNRVIGSAEFLSQKLAYIVKKIVSLQRFYYYKLRLMRKTIITLLAIGCWVLDVPAQNIDFDNNSKKTAQNFTS